MGERGRFITGVGYFVRYLQRSEVRKNDSLLVLCQLNKLVYRAMMCDGSARSIRVRNLDCGKDLDSFQVLCLLLCRHCLF